MTTPDQKNKTRIQDPLHGITLKMVVTQLVETYGWEDLGQRINIKCFTNDPSINSSLKFLRKTPWAREKVEALYLNSKWVKMSTPKNSDFFLSASKHRANDCMDAGGRVTHDPKDGGGRIASGTAIEEAKTENRNV